jgi:diacylglycerol kinase
MMEPSQPQPDSLASPPRRPSEQFQPNWDELEDVAPPWGARAGRKNLQEKFWAGLNGIKHAVRGDSSFFAHAYRCVLIAVTAGMIGLSLNSWLLLILSACLVFFSEIVHSAVDTLARAVGDPEEPQLKIAREIAAGGVFVCVVCAATVTTIVLVVRFADLLNW